MKLRIYCDGCRTDTPTWAQCSVSEVRPLAKTYRTAGMMKLITDEVARPPTSEMVSKPEPVYMAMLSTEDYIYPDRIGQVRKSDLIKL